MTLRIIRNDISKVKADIIVNTANPAPIYSSGVDTAIYKAAGEEQLLAQRDKIGFIKPGNIAVTDAFDLQAKYIIHAVGDFYIDGNHHEKEILEACYNKSLEKALELGCKSIAFPLLGTGSYGFPMRQALAIALNCVNSFLLEHDIDVCLVVFGEKAVELTGKISQSVKQYIDSNYVKEAEIVEYGYSKSYSINKPVFKKTIKDLKIDEKEEKFSYKFNSFVEKSGLKNSQIYKPAFVSKQTFSKILCEDHIPSKKAILAMGIVMHLTLEEINELLASAGLVLSNSNNFDLIIKWCYENHCYDIDDIDEALFENDCETLFSMK